MLNKKSPNRGHFITRVLLETGLSAFIDFVSWATLRWRQRLRRRLSNRKMVRKSKRERADAQETTRGGEDEEEQTERKQSARAGEEDGREREGKEERAKGKGKVRGEPA